jgi:DNA mismatch endonuclease (patch repair protein)
LVFSDKRVAVFCDGDFWHGRGWSKRRAKLLRGSNSSYWISKIEGNIARDRRNRRRLRKLGWKVLRFWEFEINRDANRVVNQILEQGRL